MLLLMNPVLQSAGGFGLFLFGMSVMTSGLKKLAGDRLHQWLARATRTPLSGAITGTAVTAVVQSSSATTVATVGFVGAGLMTFPQALGVVFGANIGTTITGWIVAVVGFKLKLGTAALPLILVAAILYLAKSRRLMRGAGKALAGFALIFLGIDFLQTGLAGASELIDFSKIDATGPGGRLLLVFVGVILTMVTQSSSATVAAALTALNTGIIDLPQAAAVVIGANVGTTATAGLATIGGNTGSRRTGFAHVIYNLIISTGAFLVLPLYLFVWDAIDGSMAVNSPEVVAVAFHSLFNAAGVVAMLPFTDRFARLVERLIPEREPPLVAPLDEHLLTDVKAAVDALESTVRMIAAEILKTAAALLADAKANRPNSSLKEVLHAISESRGFAVKLGIATEEDSINVGKLFALLHVLDHCERLAEHMEKGQRVTAYISCAELHPQGHKSAADFSMLAEQILSRHQLSILPSLEKIATELEADKPRFRQKFIMSAARGKLKGDELDAALDAARWLRRMVYHAWRIAIYSSELSNEKPCQNS